ncbi:uncharacterized protein B0J16DRAFT_316301 [Fusarium flagelliforme]|uniref:Uncharacterized protein n=1 Tax=Fusarium flagelliforme TaxID=2675880 RepID=A0A395MYA5_9HYPO|nr:uncharacterized protein B0J16DRAFT_316301 [Fusarium flagelliforme]KAH7192621.1 hypothetical protein B0J16DRAFT_316301 [Fusarium flagelliforme]RFN52463.1 hypothetical protein FIE12Z_3224 [Fusarium flagelliforme]
MHWQYIFLVPIACWFGNRHCRSTLDKHVTAAIDPRFNNDSLNTVFDIHISVEISPQPESRLGETLETSALPNAAMSAAKRVLERRGLLGFGELESLGKQFDNISRLVYMDQTMLYEDVLFDFDKTAGEITSYAKGFDNQANAAILIQHFEELAGQFLKKWFRLMFFLGTHGTRFTTQRVCVPELEAEIAVDMLGDVLGHAKKRGQLEITFLQIEACMDSLIRDVIAMTRFTSTLRRTIRLDLQKSDSHSGPILESIYSLDRLLKIIGESFSDAQLLSRAAAAETATLREIVRILEHKSGDIGAIGDDACSWYRYCIPSCADMEVILERSQREIEFAKADTRPRWLTWRIWMEGHRYERQRVGYLLCKWTQRCWICGLLPLFFYMVWLT